jgi:Family of unknown function (DUF6152)
MRVASPGMAALAFVIAWGIPATAHHSNPLYFDMATAITMEGEVLRVEWINPHILLLLQSKNEKGELETWILQGASLNNAMRQVGLKERLQPGVSISARVWPPRNPLFLNDALTVLLTRSDDIRTSSRIVGGGQIRFSNGDVQTFGGGPTF